MGIFIADGQAPFIDNLNTYKPLGVSENINKLVDNPQTTTPIAKQLSTVATPVVLIDIARFGDFLLGNAQVLATIVAVGFSIYTFVLGMKVSRLALKLILRKEGVVKKFGWSLAFVGLLAVLSALPYESLPLPFIITLYLLAITFYVIPAYWLINLSANLSTYLSPDTIIELIKNKLSISIEEGYKTETNQLKLQEELNSLCDKAGIELLPGFASLYENDRQIAVKSNKSGYINDFNHNILEEISRLLEPLMTTQSISSDETPRDLAIKKNKKVYIYQNIGSFIDTSAINESLNTLASVDNSIEDKNKIAELLSRLFEVSKRDKYAIEINDLLVDLKNHILETIKTRNLDEYKSSILIFPALITQHYKQCKGKNKQSLSYLNPIREITSELLENTLQLKSSEWVGNTIMLLYSILSLAVENDDIYLFQQFVTLFKTLYGLSREYNLKESLWTSHHLYYEILNYHLVPKLEKELRKTTTQEEKELLIQNAKNFIWAIFISLSENLKRAYQVNDSEYTTSITRMLAGSLKYLGENQDIEELDKLKEWYQKSIAKLWLNQLAYVFALKDKRGIQNKDIVTILLAALNNYSIEDISAVSTREGDNEIGKFNFPDFMEVFFDEQSEYSGNAVFMGDPSTSLFKAYVISAISRGELNNQKSVPISQYYYDELNRIIELFNSGEYKELVSTLNEQVINDFKAINQQGFTTYTTQTEQSIIDSSLNEELINRFKENVFKGWTEASSLRLILKNHRKVSKKLTLCPAPDNNILLKGFIQRHSKEYFISQDRFGYPQDYGKEYGKAISEGEDLTIYQKLVTSTDHININVNGNDAETIISEVFESIKPSNGTVLFIPFDFWEFQYRNSKNFIPKYSISKEDKLKGLRSFVGYYRYEGHKVPMLYSPERIRKDNKLVVVNMTSVGKLIIYKPHGEAERDKELFVDIHTFTDNEKQQIISANPSDIANLTAEARERKLKQEVALRVLERYSFEIINADQIHVFKLQGLSQVQ